MSLSASGVEVGLNSGEMGNSEVGHLNIGSGRVVWEMLPKINQSLKDGSFFENQTLKSTINHLKTTHGRLHLIGLCSNGAVHSHIRHLEALVDFAASENIKSLYLHLFTDGRDTPPKIAGQFINQIEKKLSKARLGKIATIIGRYFAMDRDNNWERIAKCYQLITQGIGQKYQSALEAVEQNHQRGKGDEFIEPSLIDENGLICEGDAAIVFNFREDRSRQILMALEGSSASSSVRINNLCLASMTKYFDEQKSAAIFLPVNLNMVLADSLEKSQLRQFHTAETEKYAHVTYFFNGGSHRIHQLEKQELVPSPKVATYDLMPEMSSGAVTEKVIEAVKKEHDFIVVNFANGDMVGHTGKLPAAIKAVEAVDACLLKILTSASNYQVILTADHGNCEVMINPVDGQPYTEHTTMPVPLSYLDLRKKPFVPGNTVKDFPREVLLTYGSQSPEGVLADIAPTVLEILGISQPAEMNGRSLLGSIQEE